MSNKSGFRTLLLLTVGLTVSPLIAAPVPIDRPQSYPAWWFEWEVIPRLTPPSANPTWPSSYPQADDYAVANIGQLKWIATAAAEALGRQLPAPGLGTSLTASISQFRASSPLADDYAALTQGQLRAVAELFYARLGDYGYAGAPLSMGQTRPWVANPVDDYAAVNLGQLKHVFSFNPSLLDSDQDGLVDAWEVLQPGGLQGNSGSSDPDGDGVDTRTEMLLGTNPILASASLPITQFRVLSPVQ
jgi:hypothetical protein